MANNLRVFNLISDYNEAELVKPSVSFVVENGKVYYDDVPSPIFQGKWKATYQDSHVESAQCGSSSAIVRSEINLRNLVSVEIGDCVTKVGSQAFQNCGSLISIDIPSGVTSIGAYAFNNCSSLISINIPNSVTSIGDDAFTSCSSLRSIVIPDSVTSIGESAFYGCSRLTSITIGSGITHIDIMAFNAVGATAITIKAVIPPTLGLRVFDNITQETNYPFYVPLESVEVYKNVRSQYASRIYPIP